MFASVFVATTVASSVFVQCPNFSLWECDDRLLLRVLEKMSNSRNMTYEFDLTTWARPGPWPSPGAWPLQTIDLICRMLEHKHPKQVQNYLLRSFLRGSRDVIDARHLLLESAGPPPMMPVLFSKLGELLVDEWKLILVKSGS